MTDSILEEYNELFFKDEHGPQGLQKVYERCPDIEGHLMNNK